MPVPESVSQLPVCSVLDSLLGALASQGCAVLHAPPGAGKTTVVPLAMLGADWLRGQQVLVLEPRRLAARHAAHRLATLLGEQTGETIGFRIRHEQIESDNTRVLVVTEGVLTRMLQHDAELAGIGAVVFDEFHERSLHADTALALSLQAREVLRPDLRLLVMSATLDTAPVAAMLADAPVIKSDGRQFPVETIYLADNHAPVELRGLAAFVARKIKVLLELHSGSMLVFLPGAAEIRQTARQLQEILAASGCGIVVCQLYGELDAKSQSAAVQPPGRGMRKVVLATNIAETSLTIEGVQVVIDSGLMRENRYHPGSGMNRLQTVFVSEDSADQRRGRAGRTEAGVCYRLWTRARHQRIEKQRRAEILNSDLSQLMLELAIWGIADPADLAWLDAPPVAAVAQARASLQQMAALDSSAKVTEHGRHMAVIGIAPRLAHLVLSGARHGAVGIASQLAAVLSEADFLPRDTGVDIALRLQHLALKKASTDGRVVRVRQLAQQLRRRIEQVSIPAQDSAVEPTAGVLLGFAYPERIAAARKGRGDFLLASGRGATLLEHDTLSQAPFLVVAELDEGARNARIYRAASITEHDIHRWFGNLIEHSETVVWDATAGRVAATRTVKLGAIRLSAVRSEKPERALVHAALLNGVRQAGLSALPWKPSTLALIGKIEFLRRLQCGDEYPQAQQQLAGLDIPDLSQAWLLDNLSIWFEPLLDGQTSLTALKSLNTGAAIEATIDWQLRQAIETLTPDFVTVASGSKITIDYCSGAQPVLAVRVQEMFGMSTTPAIVGTSVPLMIHLLSPARRPVQLTRDLAGFWTTGYAQVRSELRGRYPKHHWPEDPLTATATSGTKKQMAQRDR